jgi:hypothetical protein
LATYFLPIATVSAQDGMNLPIQAYTIVNTEDPADCALRDRSVLRVEHIAILVRKLSDASILNTVASRARCRELATQMIHLLDDEDEYQEFALPNIEPAPGGPLS